jgi:delta-aminolevulinic acid dehydratase/porphobilinogen synthase
MSKSLQYNYVNKKPGIYHVTMAQVEEAITGLYENGEKIVSVFPMQYNSDGDLVQVLIISEVEFNKDGHT